MADLLAFIRRKTGFIGAEWREIRPNPAPKRFLVGAAFRRCRKSRYELLVRHLGALAPLEIFQKHNATRPRQGLSSRTSLLI